MEVTEKTQSIREKLTPNISELVCYNSHLRLVNFIIYSEYIQSKVEHRDDWAIRAASWLKNRYNIERSPNTLKSILTDIRNGTRNAICASGFIGDVEPKSRYEKDVMYGKFDTYIHEFIKEPLCYVGLPANQLVYVSQRYDSIVACEHEKVMAMFMEDLNKFIIKNKDITVERKDIFKYLEGTSNRFNVFDLDLMEALTTERIEYIAKSIKKTAMNRSAILLVSIGGRHITMKNYKELMPGNFINELERDGVWKVINVPFSGRYKDIKMPMCFEILILERLTPEFDDQQKRNEYLWNKIEEILNP